MLLLAVATGAGPGAHRTQHQQGRASAATQGGSSCTFADARGSRAQRALGRGREPGSKAGWSPSPRGGCPAPRREQRPHRNRTRAAGRAGARAAGAPAGPGRSFSRSYEPVEEQHDAGSHHEGWLQTDGGVHGVKLKKFWFVLTADAQLVYYKTRTRAFALPHCPRQLPISRLLPISPRPFWGSHASLAHLSAPTWDMVLTRSADAPGRTLSHPSSTSSTRTSAAH